MEEKTEEKHHDPGWNDPPIFTYDKANEIQASAARKGTLLNKRVAYPMNKKIGETNHNPVVPSLPPSLPQITVHPESFPVPMQNKDCETKTAEWKKISKSDRLDKALKNIEQLLLENDSDEISKRIKVMEKMWIEDKLDEQVQLKLIDLTEALHEGNIELADHIQKSLMVDYVSQCSSWMSGIRQLINSKRKST